MLLVASAVAVSGQRVRGVRESLVRAVMPGADRFSEVAGDPPVLTGYRSTSEATEVVHGYVFLTSDVPPEQFGYSGPIEALVGILPDGTLTGIRVTDYQESYMSSMGDFLRTPGFQEQYAGKHIGDPFQLWGDIEGISRVSISVRALSRGVRDSARRVAAAYGGVPDLSTESSIVDPVGLSWFELRQRGFVERFVVTEPGEGTAGISLAHISNDRLGEYYFGPQLYERAQRSAERRGEVENLLLYAVDGSRLRLFRQQGWTVEQEGEVTEVDSRNVVSMGLPSGGIVSGEATMVGIMLVDGSVDMSRPFTLIYDLGDLGTHNIEYVSQEARLLAAEEASLVAAKERAAADRASATPSPDEVEVVEEATAEVVADAEVLDSVPRAAAGETGTADGEVGDGAAVAVIPVTNLNDAQAADLDFVLTEDETLLQRTLAGTSWLRVALMLLVLALGTVAFTTKIPSLRWAALTVTLFGLGFGDGGFLSVSHITSGIWAGVGVYLRDIPLLLIVAFTLITTLVWGRVFCGFLCPFGALQDFIDRFVPEALKRPLPQGVHDKAVYAKYGVLAVIVLPAVAGSRVSLYQYFEPFGTVFFRSSDVLLWTIAAAFLAASVVIPRFYCRYACPLGAALGVLSLLSLKRIERVEQCGHCKICEQKCPTGAIRGPDIDFHECVRCNVCEVQLIQKAGVCRHEMNVIRPRLIQLTAESAPEAADD